MSSFLPSHACLVLTYLPNASVPPVLTVAMLALTLASLYCTIAPVSNAMEPFWRTASAPPWRAELLYTITSAATATLQYAP